MKGMDLIMKKLKEELKYGKKGITLISLVVTIIVLLILAGITISMLFGENGLITMAQKAKNEYEEAAKNEEQQLAGIFGKNFADYNGQLNVVNGKLVNQYNEIITLKGLVGGNVSQYSIHYQESQSFSYYLNQESINNLKEWGVNVIRIGLEIEDGNGITTNEALDSEAIQDYLNTIDLLIENDIYVIAVLWNNNNINENLSIAEQYFSMLAQRYNSTNNIIYEIANEPTIEWNNIKSYSNSIISTIRNFDSNNVIIIPNSNYDTRPDLVNLNELENPYNVMTSYHMYVGNQLTDDNIKYLKQAINNGTPVFVTEWGTTLSNGNDGFFEDNSNIFVNLLNNYNLSWCNFSLTDYNFRVNQGYGEEEYSGIVKHNQWNNSLSNDILSQSGKYIKSILQGTYNLNITSSIMISRNDDTAFWQEQYRENIISIEFMKATEIPKEAIATWDVSALQDESIKAYILDDSGYKLYIISDYVIKLPIQSGQIYKPEGLFEDFINTKSIIFNNINTSDCADMSAMFKNCSSLERIENIKYFNTSNVNWMSDMFQTCSEISELDLSGWDTRKVTNIINMFSNCQKLNKIIGLENLDVSNVEYCASAFQQTYELNNLNLSNWNISKATDFSTMFGWAYATEIDIRNLDMSLAENTSHMFDGTSSLENLYMNNVTFNIDSITNYTEMFNGIKNGVNIYVKNEEIAKWIYDRITEANKTANIYYGTDDNWTEYTI